MQTRWATQSLVEQVLNLIMAKRQWILSRWASNPFVGQVGFSCS